MDFAIIYKFMIFLNIKLKANFDALVYYIHHYIMLVY